MGQVPRAPPAIGADQLAGAHGVDRADAVGDGPDRPGGRDLLAIGRFGVGYDAVDVAACTEADVVVFITAGAVDRSVAEATVGWMIALTHHVRIKDMLVRTGRWDERSRYMGRELRDRTLRRRRPGRHRPGVVRPARAGSA